MKRQKRLRSKTARRPLILRGIWIALIAAIASVSFALVSTKPQSTGPVAPRTSAPMTPLVYGYDLVNTYPHDAQAFTQGLIFRDGFLYESTGMQQRSSLRQVELETGRVIRQRSVDGRYFAEGLTDWGGQLIQLTYTTNIGFVYDLETFEPRSTFSYAGEGWGLTHDGRRLIMSDGGSQGELRFLDPATYRETGRLRVHDRREPVSNLNELEFVQGRVYANVWHTEGIVVIDPDSGDVTARIDLTGLRPQSASHPEAVLNGIAYDATRDRLFVTGKWWPQLFEIRLRRRF